MSETVILDKQWYDYVQARLADLGPIALGSVEPSLDQAMLFFKFAEIDKNVFGSANDYSNHPRNPFNKKDKKELDKPANLDQTQNMNTPSEKEQGIIKFLQQSIQGLHSTVFDCCREPSLTDRMTFFAYSHYLFAKHGIGTDMTSHPRNPWREINGGQIPLDFEGFKQIKPFPADLRPLPSLKEALAKTQVIPVLKPLPPAPQAKWRVFDIDMPARTVFEGNEGDCYKYAKQANDDCSYKAFEWADTGTMFIPRDKSVKGSRSVDLPNANGCSSCELPRKPSTPHVPYVYKTTRTKVSEYLAKVKAGQVVTQDENKN